ncbi:tetratricopeptide repeat protein, partial [Streptomyces sp. NPDC014734]|uniref:tetratricopeptide repeat protein n=1 Tax=Streptomyces sp. NPDC014734 TaxID=3364886 RepID=UPI0036FE6191
RQEGLEAIEEAVRLYRELVKTNPDAHLPDLAKSLNNLSIWLGTVGRRQEGLKAIEEAVRIRRTLAEANPDAHLVHLAKSLNNFSIWLVDVEQGEEEDLAVIEEALRHYRTLDEANRARFDAGLQHSLETAAWLESLPE